MNFKKIRLESPIILPNLYNILNLDYLFTIISFKIDLIP